MVKNVKIGLVIYSNDPETVCNAFQLGNFALNQKDEVNVFLLGKGVGCEPNSAEKFKITEQIKSFASSGGKIFACEPCLQIHQLQNTEACLIATIKDLYTIIKESEKLITF